MFLIADRGYESIRNLELYIDKGQPMIMGTKVGQKHVQEQTDAFGTFDHHLEEIEIDTEAGSIIISSTLSIKSKAAGTMSKRLII